MGGVRFPVWLAMGVVLVIGVGLAAMRSVSEWVAGGAQVASVVVLAASVLVAASRTGRARWAWGGFAVFGWSYLIAFPFPKYQEGIQPFLLYYAIEWLYGYFPPPASDEIVCTTAHSFMIVLFGALGALAGPLLAGRGAKDRPDR